MTLTPATGSEPNRPDGGPLAPNAPGTPTKTPIKLSTPQKLLVALALAGGIAIAGIGFVGSYHAVTALAYSKGFGSFSRVFTLGIDIGIGVFLAIDLLLTWLRMPYPVLRHGAWLLTGATIVFNASILWPDPLGAAMHGVIPILFIVAVEAARHAVGRIADITADKYMESPPLARWILNPAGTFVLWRRQRLWDIRKWSTVLELERERRIYIGQLRTQYSRWTWRRKASAAQMLVLSLAGDGMSIQDAIDLPKREAAKLAEAEDKRAAETRAKTEAEAEAKHQAELRNAEVEAKRRSEIAEAEAAEAEARSRTEAAAEALRLEVEANRRAEAEAARILVAETEAKLAAIARTEQDAEAEAELNRQRRAAEQARLQAQAARDAQDQTDAEARQQREQEARERAQRIAARATASASDSDSASDPNPKRNATSVSASGSVSAIGGRGAKKQAEVEAVLARLIEAADPKSYPLSEVMADFGLTQTTAYDRLALAQRLYAEVQNPKSTKTA